jgi:hypothetical protein
MPSLIIIIKTPDLEIIKPESGLYLFGISKVNELDIDISTYQYSNRFDNLQTGIYQWAVKEITTDIIKARGTNIVEADFSNCHTEYISNSNNILIPLSKHNKPNVKDITCFESLGEGENKTYDMFLPDSAEQLLSGAVLVKTDIPFTGKITIC